MSGAPKIRAIELVADLEKERRGAYAGAVGRFNFAADSMDTCIAIRTMTFKDGVAYLQAGGGIVYDSVEEEEWVETLNKLGANVKCLDQAEGESLMLALCHIACTDAVIRFLKITIVLCKINTISERREKKK